MVRRDQHQLSALWRCPLRDSWRYHLWQANWSSELLYHKQVLQLLHKMLKGKYVEHMDSTSTYTVKHLAIPRNNLFIFNGLKKEKNSMDKQEIY